MGVNVEVVARGERGEGREEVCWVTANGHVVEDLVARHQRVDHALRAVGHGEQEQPRERAAAGGEQQTAERQALGEHRTPGDGGDAQQQRRHDEPGGGRVVPAHQRGVGHVNEGVALVQRLDEQAAGHDQAEPRGERKAGVEAGTACPRRGGAQGRAGGLGTSRPHARQSISVAAAGPTGRRRRVHCRGRGRERTAAGRAGARAPDAGSGRPPRPGSWSCSACSCCSARTSASTGTWRRPPGSRSTSCTRDGASTSCSSTGCVRTRRTPSSTSTSTTRAPGPTTGRTKGRRVPSVIQLRAGTAARIDVRWYVGGKSKARWTFNIRPRQASGPARGIESPPP